MGRYRGADTRWQVRSLWFYDGTLRVWDLESNRPPRALEGHTGCVMALSGNGKCAVSNSSDFTTLRVWDLEDGQPPRMLNGHTNEVNAVALSGDGKRVVSGSSDHTLRVWDLHIPRPASRTPSATPWFSPTAFIDETTPYTYSPTRRGQNYNPGYADVDLAVAKTTHITERVNAQFRADFFNLFNHTNLAPVGLPTTGESGQISSTIGVFLGNLGIGPGEPENVQFSLKIAF